jgi:glyoxylase-like metal-dependent hydrolase (beta-lactamase superfamily II)
MLTVQGINVAVQFGADGAIVVNAGPPGTADEVLQAIRQITGQPIRYVIDTSADAANVGNNASIASAGVNLNNAVPAGGPNAAIGAEAHNAPIIAQGNVLTRMLVGAPDGSAYPGEALPSDAYTDLPQKNFHLNGEAVQIIWEPAAHSDGDSVVLFRGSDVVVTGAVFDMAGFPVIDVAHGGSVQGEIDALNRLLFLVVPELPLHWRLGGTVVIPERGRLADQGDLLQYRDMVTIVRDRVQALIKQGKTLEQVEAATPAVDYAPRYGTGTGAWTTEMFVEAVFKSLKPGKK